MDFNLDGKVFRSVSNTWQWLSGDMSTGTSEIEEVVPDAALEGRK